MDNALKERLELAALVHGWDVFPRPDAPNRYWIDKKNLGITMASSWRPDESDADSRRLEIACLNWLDDNYRRPSAVSSAVHAFDDARAKYGRCTKATPEQYRAAVLDLAVAIGRVIKEQDHD